jgi:hypothetical protein
VDEGQELMNKLDLGYIVWGSVGLVVAVPELLAAFGKRIPWPTLSTTATTLMREHPWVTVTVAAGLFVLALHLLFYPWPTQPK